MPLQVMWGNCLRSTQKPPPIGPEKKETLTVLFFFSLYSLVVIVNDYDVAMQEDTTTSFYSQIFKVLTSYSISVFHLFQVCLEPASSIRLA